ncbi:HlyD family type I secretion periplasmic adaptor subunit [Fulvimarina sp. 2208YS6-2-32]|uniref:Membrane fusion protein (MFP) family protein n=1 Tax=Fulvimarina uroteuthidis TaxID=3098149 RepID=A0ABU5I473_9HYPH|nr:HlyD family type I secretion periplasmic adaptor subunit [Fulvimarina sp. 2208YS6-2-32]MDY8108966.1 HlyD family type I secretion periplasmic adaptor subunit [Fulvimarina sp. 2208YS6-2-32]
MPADVLDRTITKSLRRQLMTAIAAATILSVGMGGVAAYAEIGGAVIGLGSIIVEGRSKQVQHNEGGVVKRIAVHEGAKVDAGQLLFVFDGTLVRANLAIVEAQLQQLVAQEARLLSELSGRRDIVFPEDDFAEGETDRIALLKSGQIELFEARRLGILGRKEQLHAQIAQLDEKVSALNAQAVSIDENAALLAEQVSNIATLHGKGLIANSQLVTVKREHASLKGSRAAVAAEIVETRQAIGEKELALSQIDKEFREAVLTELDQKRVEIAKLRHERIAARDRLTRLELRAPMTGYVHALNVHTIGRVVAPGETLMQVVPADDDLIVEAKLRPVDVDQVAPKQKARIRLTGLNQRSTPELSVTVLDVSPDATEDPKTGMTYFSARLKIPEDQAKRIEDKELRPGMPVEVFIETSQRSILSYLVKPMRDQIEHAMRED